MKLSEVLTKDFLWKHYWDNEESLREIADMFGVTGSHIHYHMKRHNIPRRSSNPTQKTREKQSKIKKKLFREGKIVPWNKGKPHTTETKKKLSETHKKLHREGKITSYNKGKTLEELFGEARASKMRQHRSEITKKYFETHKHYRVKKGWVHPKTCECPFCRAKRGEWVGKGNPFYGKKHSDKSREKMSLSRLGQKNHRWLGGYSFKDYPPEFNEILKREIKKRDNYTCQICYKKGRTIHHIDYDKNNNDKKNLITICKKDHINTNNYREYWEMILTEKINKIYDGCFT